jgi:hypothetical protein
VTGTFNRLRNSSLVLGTGSSLASWADFSIVLDETAQHIHQLVINDRAAIGAELAHTRLGEEPPPTARSFCSFLAFSPFVIHTILIAHSLNYSLIRNPDFSFILGVLLF